MSTTPAVPAPESGPRKRPRLRPWVVGVALGVASFYGLLFWPSDPETSPYDLSVADGRSRFYVTAYSKTKVPPSLTLPQRLSWEWRQYQRRRGKRNPTAYSFPARPVEPCSIHASLQQCMELTGTRYFIAVEISGAVEFGSTNSLNGAQWVAAFEHAIETSKPVVCFDFRTKRNFEDTLLVIRERPGVVKIVPRNKLAEYRAAGLVKVRSP